MLRIIRLKIYETLFLPAGKRIARMFPSETSNSSIFEVLDTKFDCANFNSFILIYDLLLYYF